MRLDKRRNAKRGIRYGIRNRIVTLLLPFIVQTVTIKTLGSDYVGIKGLFSSILSVLSLTELGVGSAIVYSMYKPIAEDDYSTIGALLNLYKKLYGIIGIVVLFLGLAITPFVRFLIEGDYPSEINLQMVFLLFVCNSVLSYWMFAYKSSLLNAYQRTDVISNVGTIAQALTCVFQVLFLFLTKNYYIFLGLSIFFTIVNNIIISIYVDKKYPNIICKGKVKKEIKADLKANLGGIIISRVCVTTRNTFDNIFISMFLGLDQATIYTNYYLILAGLNGFTGILLNSLLAGVGNSIVTQSKQENYKQMMILHTAYMIMSGWMAICMLCLYQPFMYIWVGEKLLFPEYTMIMFPLYFYIQKMGDIRSVYSDGAGLFWQNRYRTLLEAIANIILNYVFVIKLGSFGIMLATVITLFFINFFGSTIVIFKHYYTNGMKEYLLNSGFYLLITIFTGMISYMLFMAIDLDSILLNFVIRTIGCLTVVPILYLGTMFYRKDFKETYKWIKTLVK